MARKARGTSSNRSSTRKVILNSGFAARRRSTTGSANSTSPSEERRRSRTDCTGPTYPPRGLAVQAAGLFPRAPAEAG